MLARERVFAKDAANCPLQSADAVGHGGDRSKLSRQPALGDRLRSLNDSRGMVAPADAGGRWV